MTIQAVRCRGCGGAIAMSAGKSVPACLFCGEAALEPMREVPEVPDRQLPFVVDADAAVASFRRFAGSSFWYPSEIRHARVELRRVYLPGWTWSGRVDSTFNAIVQDGRTRSGKRPVTGHDVVELSGVLVPGSSAVSRAELQAVAPFSTEHAVAFDAAAGDIPFEVAQLTASVARSAGESAIVEAHRARIASAQGALKLGVASIVEELEGAYYLFPVYIGVYRHGERPYRVVVNGQTGRLTGTAPTSWIKVALVAGLALIIVGMLVLGVALIAGGAGG